MMGVIYIASALLFGFGLARTAGRRFTVIELVAASVILGISLWTWLSFLVALILPADIAAAITSFVSAGAGWVLIRTFPFAPKPWSISRPAKIAVATISGFFTLVTTALIWHHALSPQPDGLYSGAASWADYGLHMAIISHMAAGPKLLFDLPVASNLQLTYPFIMDLFSAWLVRAGWSFQPALALPATLLVAAFFQLFVSVGQRLTRRTGAALLGLMFILASGSPGGLWEALKDWQSSGTPVSSFLARLPNDYTILQLPNLQFTNFLVDGLLPQRAFDMGVGLAAVIAVLLIEQYNRPSRRLTIAIGVLIGLMPFIHPHTFIAMGAMLLCLSVVATARTRRFITAPALSGIIALILAAPQIVWQSTANHLGTGGFYSPGWVAGSNESLLAFWAGNYGVLGAVVLLGPLLCWKIKPLKRLLIPASAGAIIFVVANFYAFQPFAYDNLKLMYYSYMIAGLVLGYLLLRAIDLSRWSIPGVLLAVALITGAGWLAIVHELQAHDQFASNDDISLAEWAKTQTEPTTIFATTDRPNQPLATLAGRTIVAGYRGWLYNYHIDYTPRLEAISQALEGKPAAVRRYGASYLAISSSEPAEWNINQDGLGGYEVVYQNPSWTLYRLPANQ